MAKIRLSRKAIADLDGIWDYTAQTWSEDQAVIYYRQIYSAIQGLNSLPVFLERAPVFLERAYDVVKSGLFGFKVGHHIVFYKKGNDGSISVDRILHEKMDYQRHL